MGKLFGTNGIRGVVNESMTSDLALKIGLALGSTFQNGKILVGCDGRTSSQMLKSALISGLLSCGISVTDAGLAPTPAIQYAIKSLDFGGGVIITASHNPPEFNGIKVIDRDGVEVTPDIEKQIEKIYFTNNFKYVKWDNVGEYTVNNNINSFYLNGIIKHVNKNLIKKSSIKVILDPANGVGSLTTPFLLRKLGCKVVTINSHIDGFFPGRKPEPNEENLQTLKEAVVTSGSDIGIAHDGDADRVIFIDEKGEFHWGDISFALLIRKVLSEHDGGTVVTPIASSKLIEDVTTEMGGDLIITKVGSVTVARKLKEVNGLIGGEENGGIFYAPHQYVRDGAMGAALLIELISETEKTLSELIKELPKYYQVKKKIECPENIKNQVLLELKEQLKEYKINDLDGVKIWKGSGWLLIRPSGTEPLLRCYSEAPTKEEAEKISEWGLKMINSVLTRIKNGS
ncbi:MAG: phosphoglucosamine mutase [Candidatus Odinarchaeia archaeon]